MGMLAYAFDLARAKLRQRLGTPGNFMVDRVDVHYTCKVCDADFIISQWDPEPDEDADLCWDCLDVVMKGPHGTHDDPWTKQLILEARGLA